MAESCPGTSSGKFSWLVAWHIRDETYSKVLAEIVDHQHRILFATQWGEALLSSSDGERYRAGGCSEVGASTNTAMIPTSPSTLTSLIGMHPFIPRSINVTVRDPTLVLDGLLCYESEL